MEMKIYLKDYLIPLESDNMQRVVSSTDPELIISGPIQCGKTLPIMVKLLALHSFHKDLKTLVLRKERNTLSSTILPQLFDKILRYPVNHRLNPFRVYGGLNPDSILFDNGGVMRFGGMDKSGKILGSEYDVIFANQVEQLTLEEWEKAGGRANGRAGNWRDIETGERLYQIIGDANPDHDFHWIPERFRQGRTILLSITHKDNAELFRDGDWTEYGKSIVAGLKRRYTGITYRRLVKGEWCGGEGAVFPEFDRERHVIDTLPNMDGWSHIRAIDHGMEHPTVCLWMAKNPMTDEVVVYKEWKMTGLRAAEHADIILRHSEGIDIEASPADHQAEQNATMQLMGVDTVLAIKRVVEGVDIIKRHFHQDKIKIYKDLLIEPDQRLIDNNAPIDLIHELPSIRYRDRTKQRGESAIDDKPLKGQDDSCDALRYGLHYFEEEFNLDISGTVEIGNILPSYIQGQPEEDM